MIKYSEESLESRWYREHSIRIHMKRLKDIKERTSSVAQSPVRFNSVNRSRVEKNNFKHFEMVKQNIMLYDKLTQISERKYNKREVKGPRSLNISMRKKEADRIIQDNFEFVKRLTERESIFSVSKLRKEYDIQEQYKKSISKHNLHERLKKITESELKLPPIFQDSGKGSSTSRQNCASKISSKPKLSHSEESSIKDTPKKSKPLIKTQPSDSKPEDPAPINPSITETSKKTPPFSSNPQETKSNPPTPPEIPAIPTEDLKTDSISPNKIESSPILSSDLPNPPIPQKDSEEFPLPESKDPDDSIIKDPDPLNSP